VDNRHLSLPREVDNIFELLQREKVVAYQGGVGNIFIDMDSRSKVVEVPVQDARTKHLIHLLAR
jgi:chaperonin cofactor prefoldin